jgi:hypothetical protein
MALGIPSLFYNRTLAICVIVLHLAPYELTTITLYFHSVLNLEGRYWKGDEPIVFLTGLGVYSLDILDQVSTHYGGRSTFHTALGCNLYGSQGVNFRRYPPPTLRNHSPGNNL